MRIIAFILLITCKSAFSQFQTEFKGNHLATDQFGYYYEIGDTEIKKFTKTGELYRTYSNNVLGVIESVDVSSPYKILVYFRDFTKILILDNFLSPTTETIELTDIDLEQTTLVCRSYNEGTWYYEPVLFELIRKNQELVTTNTSGNLANLLGKNIQPNFLVEYNNIVYLNDPKNGILVFDMYGTYLKNIPLYDLHSFQVKDKFIVYANSEGFIESYDFFTLEKTLYKPLENTAVKFVQIQNENIYIVNDKGLLSIDKIKK